MDKPENYCNFVDFANSIAIGNIEIIGSIKMQVSLLHIKKEYIGAVEIREIQVLWSYRILQKIDVIENNKNRKE